MGKEDQTGIFHVMFCNTIVASKHSKATTIRILETQQYKLNISLNLRPCDNILNDH